MAITYTKPNLAVFLSTVMGNTYNLSRNDSISALEAFKRKKIMEFSVSGGKSLVPYHAVQLLSFAYGEPTSETKGDPYGCDESSEDKVVIIRKNGNSDDIFAETSSVKTAKAFWDAVVENPNIPVKWDDGNFQFDYAPTRNDDTAKIFAGNNGTYYVAAYHNDQGEEYTVNAWFDSGD